MDSQLKAENEDIFTIFFSTIFKDRKLKNSFVRNIIYSLFGAFFELSFVSVIFLLLNSFKEEPNLTNNNTLILIIQDFFEKNNFETFEIALLTSFIALLVGLFKIITYKQALNLSCELSINLGSKAFNGISERKLVNQTKRPNSRTLERLKYTDRLIGDLFVPIIYLIPITINTLAVIFGLLITSGVFGVMVLLVIGIIYFSLGIYYKKFTKKLSKSRDINLTEITTLINNYLSSLIETRMNDREKYINERYKILEKKSAAISYRLGMAIYLPKISIETIVIFFICLLIYISSVSKYTFITVEQVGIIIACLQRLLPLVNQFFSSLTVIKSNSFLLFRINQESYEDINSFSKEINFKNQKIKVNKSEKNSPILELKKCTISYDSKINILSNISLKIFKSDFININGASGAGKSSLLNLISGLVNPKSGYILINGKYLNYDNDDEIINWRKKVAYVPQQIHITQSSLNENIAWNYFDKKIALNYKKIKLLRHICFIEEKDLSINFNKGELIEGGYSISGGQKQRIGIARSLYQSEKKILILDESLSGIEEDLQKNIILRIRKYLPELAIILVTHNKKISDLAENHIYLKQNND